MQRRYSITRRAKKQPHKASFFKKIAIFVKNKHEYAVYSLDICKNGAYNIPITRG